VQCKDLHQPTLLVLTPLLQPLPNVLARVLLFLLTKHLDFVQLRIWWFISVGVGNKGINVEIRCLAYEKAITFKGDTF
jgi:hypothetical protein